MRNINCLIIGHNEIAFKDYVERQNINSGVTAELKMTYLNENGIPLSFQDIYNRYETKEMLDKYDFMDSNNLFNTAVAYLGTFLTNNGLTMDYISSFHREKEKLTDKLKNNNYDTIAITTTFHFIAYPIQEIISFIRRYNTTSKIIVGGPYILDNIYFHDNLMITHRALQADIYIFNQQGEQTLVNVVKAVRDNTDLNDMANICYIKNGEIVKNHFSEENNLLENNKVRWDLFANDIKYYNSIRTTISCPLNCAFCTYPAWSGRKYSHNSVEAIKYELDQLRAIGKTKTIYFMDDTFNVPKDRFKMILHMMIKEKYEFSWHSYIRLQFLDDEDLQLMVESKCEGIMLGLETANNDILRNMNKNVTVEQYYKSMEKIKKYKIPTMAYFIIGFPGETTQTFSETINFIKYAKPDFYRPFIWLASSVTPIMEKKEQYGIEGSNYVWKHHTMDSATAMNLLETMFYEIKESIWIPHYNFDYTGVAHLLARELSMSQIKTCLRLFYEEIRYQKESSSDGIRPLFSKKFQKILRERCML